MQEEYLDIVDENGNPTVEKELRSVVHEKGLWHKVVGVYFYRLNENNIEILVHLRSKNKDSQPNLWDARFGGHIVSGKTIAETVIEEIEEETGLNVEFKDLSKGETIKHDRGKNKEFSYVFYYNFLGNINEMSLNNKEVQEIKWMSENEILQSRENHPEIWLGTKEGMIYTLKELKSKL